MSKENQITHHLVALLIAFFITLFIDRIFACAEENNKKDLIIEELKYHIEQINDFTATIAQEKRISLFNSTITSSGLIKWKKPNLLFISLDAPDTSKLIFDGTTFWMYYPDERSVEKYSLRKNKNLPHSFFMLPMINNLFERNHIQNITLQADNIALDITPSGSLFKTIKLLFSKKNWLIRRIEMVEKDGDSTVIAFSKIIINSHIPNETFTFTPPQGVTVSSVNEFYTP
jgi:outer membrane lipoprotein carrier protein